VICAHCGRETGPAYGSVSSGEKIFRLCHTCDLTRPDCYRRVTVYHEVIGFLRLPGIEGALVGVKDIFGHLHDDDGTVEGCLGCFYDIPTVVCVTHKRFVPCRDSSGTCVMSCREDNVGEVRRYQAGE
jgi:hypothetical protein